MILYW